MTVLDIFNASVLTRLQTFFKTYAIPLKVLVTITSIQETKKSILHSESRRRGINSLNIPPFNITPRAAEEKPFSLTLWRKKRKVRNLKAPPTQGLISILLIITRSFYSGDVLPPLLAAIPCIQFKLFYEGACLKAPAGGRLQNPKNLKSFFASFFLVLRSPAPL